MTIDKTRGDVATNYTRSYRRIEAATKEQVTRLQENLVSLETSNDKKIRLVVLEVLASVTENKQETRFFGDWLKALFISREQFNVRRAFCRELIEITFYVVSFLQQLLRIRQE